jgi:hypothetical protein
VEVYTLALSIFFVFLWFNNHPFISRTLAKLPHKP